MIVVDKAFAYITSQGRLLAFTHADSPEAGVQVPAGTIRRDEPPSVAVLREAHEESGLSGFSRVDFLGTVDFDASPFGKSELHRRHFFHLPFTGAAPEKWRHYERDPSDGDAEPIAFDFHWLELSEAAQCLIANHGQLVHVLEGKL